MLHETRDELLESCDPHSAAQVASHLLFHPAANVTKALAGVPDSKILVSLATIISASQMVQLDLCSKQASRKTIALRAAALRRTRSPAQICRVILAPIVDFVWSKAGGQFRQRGCTGDA